VSAGFFALRMPDAKPRGGEMQRGSSFFQVVLLFLRGVFSIIYSVVFLFLEVNFLWPLAGFVVVPVTGSLAGVPWFFTLSASVLSF